jgi:hypothetical protein
MRLRSAVTDAGRLAAFLREIVVSVRELTFKGIEAAIQVESSIPTPAPSVGGSIRSAFHVRPPSVVVNRTSRSTSGKLAVRKPSRASSNFGSSNPEPDDPWGEKDRGASNETSRQLLEPSWVTSSSVWSGLIIQPSFKVVNSIGPAEPDPFGTQFQVFPPSWVTTAAPGWKAEPLATLRLIQPWTRSRKYIKPSPVRDASAGVSPEVFTRESDQ